MQQRCDRGDGLGRLWFLAVHAIPLAVSVMVSMCESA